MYNDNTKLRKIQVMNTCFRQYFNNIALVTLSLSLILSTACDKTRKKRSSSSNNQINWVHSYENAKERAVLEKRPVMIDFWAEWCTACLELDKTTYADPTIIEFINSSFIAAKIDNTEMNEKSSALLQKYNIVGLPTIIFLDAQGKLMNNLTISGYHNESDMLKTLKQAKQLVEPNGQCKNC